MAVDNNVTLVGNLVADPELRYTKGGTAVADLRMAVNRRWNKDGEWMEETSFFDVTAWSEMAEHIGDSLSMGMRVTVTGRLEEQRWEDKETGDPLTLGTGMASIRALAHSIIQSLPDPTDSGVTI